MIDTELTQFYDVESVLGRGTAGVVFRAVDRRNQHRVAIKQFTRQEKSSADFFRELIVANRLVHPYLVQTLHMFLGRSGNRYIIFEFMDSGSLRTRLKRGGPLLAREACHIVLDCAYGLQFAHRIDVVHCDLKPENILAASRPDGGGKIWKLTDFGLAQNLLSSSVRNVSVGTPAYMAPEQFFERPTPRADLYSLGVILYELLAGRRPFHGDPQEMARLHAVEEPDFGLIADQRLRGIVQKLLAKVPARRHSHAGELIDDLRLVLSGPLAGEDDTIAAAGDAVALRNVAQTDVHVNSNWRGNTGASGVVSGGEGGASMTRLMRLFLEPLWRKDLQATQVRLHSMNNDGVSELVLVCGAGATRLRCSDGSYLGRVVFSDQPLLACLQTKPLLYAASERQLCLMHLGGDVLRRWPIPPGLSSLSTTPSGDAVLLAYRDHVRFMGLESRKQWKLNVRNYNHMVHPVLTTDGLLALCEGPLEPAIVFLNDEAHRLRSIRLDAPVSVIARGSAPGMVWVGTYGVGRHGKFGLESVLLEGEGTEARFEQPVLRAQATASLLITSDLDRMLQLTDLRDGELLTVTTDYPIVDLCYCEQSRLLLAALRKAECLSLRCWKLSQTEPGDASLNVGSMCSSQFSTVISQPTGSTHFPGSSRPTD